MENTVTVLQAVILGLVQGATEFLPVSSSGHLVLAQKIFGIEEGAVLLSCMLHVGTLAAVMLVFHKDIAAMIQGFFGGAAEAARTRSWGGYFRSFAGGANKLLALLVVATIPTVVFALAFDGIKLDALGGKTIIEYTFQGNLLGWGFLLTSVILLIASGRRNGRKKLNTMRFSDAAWMGLMQGVAIVPAVSRSGSTIAGGLYTGLDRGFAARFSMLMSIPAILGSFILEMKKAMDAGLAGQPWGAILIGTLVAAVSGFFAIKFLLKVLERAGLKGFALYVLVLGLLVLADQYWLHIVF